jgi:hypothetical protein
LDGSEDGFTDGLLVNVELGQFPPDAPCLISTLPLKFSGTDSSAPLFNASLISLVKVQVPIIVKATTVSDDSTCDGETEGLTLGLSVSCANICEHHDHYRPYICYLHFISLLNQVKVSFLTIFV